MICLSNLVFESGLDLNVVERQPEAYIQAKDDLFSSDGSIGEASRRFLQVWMDHYVAWVRKHAA
jgi:cell division septal protein FtsQ